MKTKRINIIDSTFAGILRGAMPEIEVDGISFILKDHYPDITIIQNKLKHDCDLLLDYTINENNHKSIYKSIPIIHFNRLSKSEQLCYLNSFEAKPLIIPLTTQIKLVSDVNAPIQNISIHLDKCNKYVIKREYGARGCNQALVPSYLIEDFLIATSYCSTSKLKKWFPEVYFTTMEGTTIGKNKSIDIENYESTHKYFDNSPILIQEYIPDITKEFRLVVAGDSIFYKERELNDDGGFIIANGDYSILGGSKEEYQILTPDDTTFPKEVISFIHQLNLGLASIDLFYTSTNRWGIFEYGYEFAMRRVDAHVKRTILNSFFTWLIKMNNW